MRTRMVELEDYIRLAPEFREKLLHGSFMPSIKEQFLSMLEYFGQSPIIVRSSSLLEDGIGNAFAGKYEPAFKLRPPPFLRVTVRVTANLSSLIGCSNLLRFLCLLRLLRLRVLLLAEDEKLAEHVV